MLHLILFLFFGAICVAGAINLLVQSHPINSALSLIVVMGSLAAEYLLLGAEFVAAVQVIVYAGADHGAVSYHHHAAECRQRRTHARAAGSRFFSAFPGVVIGWRACCLGASGFAANWFRCRSAP